MLSPYLFNLYAEYIMRNAGLDEAQAGIKNAGVFFEGASLGGGKASGGKIKNHYPKGLRTR